MSKTRIGIIGYGNIGRGVEAAVKQNSDIELVAIFTRRPPETLQTNSPAKVIMISDAERYTDSIDVMLLCGGSATDLPEQGPQFARMFNTVDTFDTHARIPEYFDKVNASALAGGKTGIISVGWDPGLFSMLRMISGAILPKGMDYTFWGKGVSQGHSDAIRRVPGVKNGIQYTVPFKTAIERVRTGSNPELSTREKHFRECYVVAEEDADKTRIEAEIKNMPNYFADYNTTVNFITEEDLKKNHSKMPHGGFVFRSGFTGESKANNHIIEFSLKLDSNPEFTSNVLLAYARAAHRMNREGLTGGKTVFDVPLSYLSPQSNSELRRKLL